MFTKLVAGYHLCSIVIHLTVRFRFLLLQFRSELRRRRERYQPSTETLRLMLEARGCVQMR